MHKFQSGSKKTNIFLRLYGWLAYIVLSYVFKIKDNTNRAYVIILDRQNKSMIVVKNLMSLPKTWDFPGGGVHRKESHLEGACREIKEEINLEIKASDLVKLYEYRSKSKKTSISFFLYFVNRSKLKKLEYFYPEILEARWVPIRNNLQLGDKSRRALNYYLQSKRSHI